MLSFKCCTEFCISVVVLISIYNYYTDKLYAG